MQHFAPVNGGKKSHMQETLNILTCVDITTNTDTTCLLSCDTCHVSPVICHLSVFCREIHLDNKFGIV